MRKWTYLVATLLMAGTTATFTGCIDTDEPEGIVDLRGAKSDLIKAQAAVKLVEVEWQKAKVAYQELENKSKELSNQYQEYDNQMHALDVKLKELEVERAQAATEREKAEAEAKIAQANRDKAFWENKMAEEAEIFKASLLKYQTATAQAQEAYDNAMKLIEAGKLLLSDGEKAIINKAQQRLFVASASLQEYYGWLKDAQNEYDAAIMAKKTRTLPQLEATLKLAELAVERQEKVVKENERLLALADEFSSANWDAEVKNLDKQIQDAKTEQGEAEKKKSSIINDAEYHKAATALKLEQDTLGTDQDAPTAKTAWGAYIKAKKDSAEQYNTVDLKIKEFKSEPVNAAIKDLFEKDGADRKIDGYRDGVFFYGVGTYKQSEYDADRKALNEAEDPTTVTLNSTPLRRKAQIESWIKYVGDFGVSGESIAQQQALLKDKEAKQTKAAEAYTKGLAEWQVLADAVSSNGENLKAVPTDKDAENEPSIKTAVTTYNTAITALNAAVTAYNKAFEDSYKKAYDKSLADAKEKRYIELLILKIAEPTAWTDFTTSNPNATNAEKIAKLEEIVVPANITAAKKDAEDHIKTDDVIAAAKKAGNDAWKDPEKKEKQDAVDEAEKAAKAAYNSISPAMGRYETLAEIYYGQTLKDDVALDGVGGITGESREFVEKDNDKPGYLKAPKTAISDDNFTKLTAVEYNEVAAKGSLRTLSVNAFGGILGVYNREGRLTPVEEKDVREYVEDHNNVSINASTFGLLGAKIETADAVQLCKDLIAAKDKLDEVLAMLNEVLANLDAEIKVNNAKMDPFIAATAEKLAAVEKAQADVEAAEDAKNAFTIDLDAEILSCEGFVKDLEAIKKDLVAQINSITGGTTANPITAEQYADIWKNNVALAEQALANYKEEVDVANESIKMYKANRYTLAYNVQKAELKKKKAEEAYNIALAIYEKALADVQNILATLTK